MLFGFSCPLEVEKIEVSRATEKKSILGRFHAEPFSSQFVFFIRLSQWFQTIHFNNAFFFFRGPLLPHLLF